ncbi:hypothetical protein GWO13_09355 [Candidatus Bathyarchaeota archaeon]|nr:hypothetical protein [Candidatus Bathyarchaeota archaeon]
MVTAGKVFKLAETTPLSELASKLSNYRREEAYEKSDYKFTLIMEITGSGDTRRFSDDFQHK